jgi:tape measure domain-containing protein
MADAQLEMVVKLVDQATSNLKTIKKEIGGLSEEVKTSSSKMSSFASVVRTGLIALGSGAVLGAVKSLTGAIIDQAARFEQSQIAFGTMLGSAEAGIAMLRELTDFAAKTPFTLPGVEDSARLLLAMGVESENIIPTLKALGNTAAGLSVPMEQIALAYGQVRAANQLTGAELRQFINAGVPLLKELATMYETTEANVKKMVETGQVGFDDVEKAFKNMTGEGGVFFNLMDKQAKTFSGQVSNMKDNITKLARELGGSLLNALKPLVEKINEFLNTITGRIQKVGLTQWIEENKTMLLVFAGVIGGVVVGAVVGLVVALWTLLAPVLLIGAAFTALGAAIGFFVAKWPEITATVTGVWNAVVAKFNEAKEAITDALNAMWETIVGVFNAIVAFFNEVWEGIKSVFIFAISLIVGYVVTKFEEMGIDIVQVITDISLWLTGAWETIRVGVVAFLEGVRTVWQTVWGAISSWIMNKWNEITTTFKLFADGFMLVMTPWLTALSTAWTGMWTAFTSVATTAWEGAKTIVKSSINWIIEKVNKLIEKINEVAKKGASVLGLGDKVPQIKTIPLLAKGGVVSTAGAAIVGEAGPELVSLPRGATVSPLQGAGQAIVININYPTVMTDEDIVEKIGDPIIRVLKQHAAIA